MTDRLPPPPVDDDDELPPCIGARLRGDAASYESRQRQAQVDELEGT